MARISRRDLIKTEKVETINSSRVGIYTRLSQERAEEWRNKSYSIESQVEICQEYINKENMTLVKIYTDYEYSGTNFDRPGYIEMMDDVRNGFINCIIIRDLSRLGREHLEMGRLVDKVFPFLGVRFISVIDKIDTEKGIDAKLSFEILIKNLINDMYAKDIGQKIKTSKIVNAKQGFFIGSNPPFGYKVVRKDGGRKLEPDEVSMKVVKRIFNMYVDGVNTLKIAKQLNGENIATSSAYNKTGNITREPGEPQWRKGTIANMLRQRVYTGCLVQGTKENVPGKQSGHYRQKPMDEWIVVENAHEAIISEELFNIAQEILDNNKDKSEFKITRHDMKRNPVNKYKGVIFDANTNLLLIRNGVRSNKKNAKFYYYKFTNEENNGILLETPYISVMESDLDNLVIKKLRNVLSIDASGEDCKEGIIDIFNMKIEVVEKNRKSISLKISKLNSDLKRLYENYSLGKIEKDDYLKKRILNRKDLTIYEKNLSDLDLEIISIKTQAEEEIGLFDDLFSNKEINCIIVKDMSRFMRNYIEMGDYLENIFPFMGIRFIAINDGYDSSNEVQNGTELDIQFKNLLNDYYSRDISEKMTTALLGAKKQGKYTSGTPPYGYLKDPEDNYKLVIDEKVADNVRYIFQLLLDGHTLNETAKTLNSEGVITARARRKEIKGYDSYSNRWFSTVEQTIWSHSMVRRIFKE